MEKGLKREEDFASLRGLLEAEDEKTRLYAVAKMEEHFHESFGPRDYAKVLAKAAREDDSQVVRAAALRALYHESGECWPYRPEDRAAVRELLAEIRERDGQTLDRTVARELAHLEAQAQLLLSPSERRRLCACDCGEEEG